MPGRCCSPASRAPTAPPVASGLLGPQFFSGWGIRTVAHGEARYNPMSYHNGSIWPHDNALIALGFARYGLKRAVAQVFKGLFDAATYMDLRRLPELFCGFQRQRGRGPTLYPVACAPQAWASATPFSLIEASLGLEFDAATNEIRLRTRGCRRSSTRSSLRNLRLGDVERRSQGSPPWRRGVAGSSAHARQGPGLGRLFALTIFASGRRKSRNQAACRGFFVIGLGAEPRETGACAASQPRRSPTHRAAPACFAGPVVERISCNQALAVAGRAAPVPLVTVLGSKQAEGILGKEVRSSADENMGRIVDVIVDRTGQVRAAVIDFGGFLGVGSRKIAVDWKALQLRADGRSATSSPSS